MIGVDNFNGGDAQLASFQSSTGATYTLLKNGGIATGGNFFSLYGDRDNYVVINKQGIVRYNADPKYFYGNRYHLQELTGCIDSLVSQPVAVPPPVPKTPALSSAPNPFQARTTVALAMPSQIGMATRVTVHDLSGRLIATLWEGPLSEGVARLSWDGRASGGAAMPPGIYVVQARVGATTLSQRVVRIR
jgi:FlgD Ig-like domain